MLPKCFAGKLACVIIAVALLLTALPAAAAPALRLTADSSEATLRARLSSESGWQDFEYFYYADYDGDGSTLTGQSYLELSRTERDMIDLVATNFDKVIVVVNANNPMELGFVNDYDSIGAVLLAPGTGRTAMNALSRILKGTVNPSGRSIETYVYDQKATPAYNNYGNFTFDNVSDLQAQYTAADRSH